jgi:hypothetical protein
MATIWVTLSSATPKASIKGVMNATTATQNFREVSFRFQSILIGILPFFN